MGHELDRDHWRLGRRLPGGGAQPSHGLRVASLSPEDQVLADRQRIRTRGHQRHRGLAMQQAAGRARHVPVDRVVHELVPEHDPVVGHVEQLGVERVAKLPHHVSGWTACDGRDITERDGIAEDRRDLQELQRGRREVPQAANHEVTERGRQLEGRRLHAVPVPAQHASVGQRAQHGDDPQRVPAGLGQHGASVPDRESAPST